ncbi:hypothetical protein ASPACDRAFT_121054 [Aspergillus aculeatus ATCC 16872]|uniref:Uncharacterized protein n=1 Tax=Aspergillus aculeatus (strain ATCC 16872 / CBS 172.66 / WB 5094) TaxID=690307 RepID=A0A1L9WTS6_ASPA1|nr:uncharacterized protein ASPACDRAFT_121054 [Aspergillus aculeatus ATCC 16872]OJJ99538.1 hypothetical protein ASPACDRAFT_121054 [Aspergillus aculeatus ATCC 16872]
MSTPLSPWTSSRQNSRVLSSNHDDAVEKEDVEAGSLIVHDQENILSNPSKSIDDVPISLRVDEDHDPGYESSSREEDNADVESLQIAPSSPFQLEGRDETVDFARLRAITRQPLESISEHSATPRKRSYEQVPDYQEIDEESEERYKKVASRREASEIGISADDDIEPVGDQQCVAERIGQGVIHGMVENRDNEGMTTLLHKNESIDDGLDSDQPIHIYEANDPTNDDFHDSIDDTRLSTFSAVPDMTTFAELRSDSPYKSKRSLSESPSQEEAYESRSTEPATSRTARKSPRKSTSLDASKSSPLITPKKGDFKHTNVTPNLLDFSDQPAFFSRARHNMQNERYSPLRRSPLRNTQDTVKSPTKASLLDFDIPSIPTPRSIPTVTPRELESLKSGFLSEISSLKATLSGKEAEVASLKKAVADAERRVGEALEEVHNESTRRETLEIEQVEWQQRGQELEAVLRDMKAEILGGEQEKERLVKRAIDAEKMKEHLEGRVLDLQSQLTASRKSASEESSSATHSPSVKTAAETAKEVQDAVKKVARELHTAYQKKHETKVAALKKSYEARWEERVRQAENKLKVATEENEHLRKVTVLSEASRANSSLLSHEMKEIRPDHRVLEAQVKDLQQEVVILKDETERLHAELKVERAEKGELVAAVDEWLSIQPVQPSEPSLPPSSHAQMPQSLEPSTTTTEPAPENIQRNVSQGGSSSSTRPPSTGAGYERERKIPKIGVPVSRQGRGNSGSKSGIAVFTPGRSGIMGSIERMGRGGA